MMMKRLVVAVPLALGWTIYTAQITLGNIILGYIFSVAVLSAIGARGDNFNLKNVPMQLVNTIMYILLLALEVLKAGIEVTRIALSPSLPIDPDIAKVNTQDETENPVISAISAHGITITPGELVIDFEETHEDGVLMIVHSLNMKESNPTLDSDQTRRLKRIKGILGYD